MELAAETRVRRRRVIYVPGYDPFPPSRYRDLYRREGPEQARIGGYELSVGRGDRPNGWRVRTVTGGAETVAEVEVMAWADIVRRSMQGGILAAYARLVPTAWTYVSTGAIWRLVGLRKGPVIGALYPVVMLLAQLAAALGLGGATGALAIRALAPLGEPLAAAAGVAIGLGMALLLLRGFRALDGRLYAYYLLNDFAFSARWRGANPPALEARLAAFTREVSAALREDWDEVLVVGHSSGAHLAVSVVADAVRDGVPAGRVVALLTLGQAVPMVSFLPEAWRLRADLALLAASDRLTWVDVSAPADGGAFALCDPVAVSGVKPPGARWPLVLSAAFSRTVAPEKLRAMRWRFLRRHFQYLCAFDDPRPFDYFAITAGPLTLAERFRDRRPSAQRIERPVSGHTSTAP